ncbi:unnamed protein product [Durusdinium trenchii]|uniref:Uncharacterized protein n=2 Tax=Durusdinium trenchii TaxID=1381693 RepID=A0ABP0J6J6_9DINO
MPRPKSNNSACKFCRKRFGVDPNPTVLNQPDDLLKRRCPMSKDCKVCHGFIKNHPVYSEMSSSALETHLQDPQNFEKFIREHEEWCEQRRNGSKRRHAEGEKTTTAEQTSSFETKQVLGYLWTKQLLKKHGKPIPSKFQTIKHQGQVVKGAILEEWVVGSIEVSASSAKTAKHVAVIADGGSDDDNVAAETFDVA